MKETIFLILISILLTSYNADNEKICIITGKVVDRKSKTLLLVKQTDDLRFSSVKIPVDRKGNFSFKLNYKFIEAYELVFKDEFKLGSWRPILFFPDNDTVKFVLYSEERADSNKIIGSKLSLKNINYLTKWNNKFGKKLYYWYDKEDSLKHNFIFNSDYGNLVSDSINSITNKYQKWTFKLMVKNHDMFGASLLFQFLYSAKRMKIYPIDSLEKYSNRFYQKFPNHPYTNKFKSFIKGLKNIKIGGVYADFTAYNLNNNKIKLSKFILNNKLTLIDLWTPWCRSCIVKSKNTIPIYNKYKDFGFNVVGVIGGIKNEKEFKKALNKYKYPWIIFSEINKKNKVREKYNISNSGGSQFLVNSKGKILAINPTSDELKKFLKAELNN